MWIYRLGLTQGEGARADRPAAVRARGRRGRADQRGGARSRELEATVARARPRELAAIPLSQLAAMKLIVNQAYENMGLASTQTLGPILDGLMRNTPDAQRFIELAEREGVRAAVAERDGPFGDYSQAPPASSPTRRTSSRAEPPAGDAPVGQRALGAVCGSSLAMGPGTATRASAKGYGAERRSTPRSPPRRRHHMRSIKLGAVFAAVGRDAGAGPHRAGCAQASRRERPQTAEHGRLPRQPVR